MRTCSTLARSGAAAALLAAALVGCAGLPAGVPSDVMAPAGEMASMTIVAHGVQIYECRAVAAGAPAWTFVAPEADLFDTTGRRIGRHGAGPAWRHVDGSGFIGTVRARVDSPRAGAIPWLLLAVRPEGLSGLFSEVSSVQRVNTVAGQPPADGCTIAALGSRVHMAYRADYVLYTPHS